MIRKCPPKKSRLAEAPPAGANANKDPGRSAKELLHELQVHQIELEMQNEALREAQLALEESRDHFADFYEFAPVGYLTVTENGLIAGINLTGAALLGADRTKLIRQPFAQHVRPEDAERWHLHLTSVLNQEKKQQCELTLRTGQGSLIHVRLDSLRLIKDRQAPTVRIVLTDVTEQKRVEEELIAAKQAAEQSSLAQSRFLAATSHDLRQPLQAISLFHDAMARMGLNAEQQRISDYLAQSIESLGDLLNVLLDISQLDAGSVRPHPEAIPVVSLFNKVNAEFSPMAADKSLRFKLCFPLREMAIATDAKLLMSLLGNLIGNAIKYTPRGGILVAVRRRGDQALIQVWDSGIGISPDDLGTIFEEYFQIDNPERDRTKGLGLGLAIVKRLARLLDTDVVCRSKPGKGSVFEFRLPLVDQGAATEKPDRPSEAEIRADVPAPLRKRRIVVVEDDVMVARAIQLSLESPGMSVRRYGSAEEALADAGIADADFYISDFRLPGLNGVEFLHAVRQRSSRPVRAALLTGDTSSDRIEATGSSEWPVLFKPVDLKKLILEIESRDHGR